MEVDARKQEAKQNVSVQRGIVELTALVYIFWSILPLFLHAKRCKSIFNVIRYRNCDHMKSEMESFPVIRGWIGFCVELYPQNIN